MKWIFRKAVFSVAGLALSLGWASGAGAQSAAAQTDAAGMAEEVYKNIQVLKGVPAEQVIPTMQFFGTSLGVECNFCHVEKRELDVKETKQTAREMMRMVSAVNEDTFGGRREVTCFSCHRGSEEPVGMPQVAGQDSQPDPVIPLDALLGKYAAALGGAAALQKISTRVAKGAVTENRPGQPPHQSPVEIFSKAPDKRFTVTHLADGERIAGYNGGLGWAMTGEGQPRDRRSAELDAARLEDTFYFAGRMKQVFSELRVEGTAKIGGREVYVVYGHTEALPLVKLYFDRESGMLVRLTHYTKTAVGRFPTQIDYADFRKEDGVKMPFRWTISQIRGRRYTYQMEEVQQNIPVGDSKFVKPGKTVAAR